MSKTPNLNQADEPLDDDILPEYDFSQGVRGKHFHRTHQIAIPGVQFLTDSKGRKKSVLLDLIKYKRLWLSLLEKDVCLDSIQFLVDPYGTQNFALLQLEQHLKVWEEIYDSIISTMLQNEAASDKADLFHSDKLEELAAYINLMQELDLSKQTTTVPPEVISV